MIDNRFAGAEENRNLSGGPSAIVSEPTSQPYMSGCGKHGEPGPATLSGLVEADTRRVLCVGSNVLLYGVFGVLNDLVKTDATWVGTIRETLDHAARGDRFDVVLLDLRVSDLEGFDSVGRAVAAFPEAAFIVTAPDDDPATISMALKAGARGFIPNSARADVLRYALPLVLKGEFYVPPSAFRGEMIAASRAPETVTAAPPAERKSGDMLTRRQTEVLLMLAAGKSNKQIARDMLLIDGTVKLHVKAILRKLSVNNRTQAVMAAARAGYLPPHLVGALPDRTVA